MVAGPRRGTAPRVGGTWQTYYPVRGAAPWVIPGGSLTTHQDGEGQGQQMDVFEYGRVIRRQHRVVALGLIITFVVVFLALVRVSADGLFLRSSPIYGARSVLLVTEPGFPWGRASVPDIPQADTARMEYLAGVHAALARSERVRGIIRTGGEPLPARAYDVAQLMSSSGHALPLIEVLGQSATGRGAVAIANAVATALKQYIRAEQNRSRVPTSERVELRVVTRAEKAEVLQGVKLTTPILLLLLGSVVTLVFAFARDNLARQRAASELASAPLEPASRTPVGFESAAEEAAVGRTAGASFSSQARGTAEGP